MPVQSRERAEFFFPIESERNQGRGNQDACLADAGGEDQRWKNLGHGIVPMVARNGTMILSTNGGWKSRGAGPIRTSPVDSLSPHTKLTPILFMARVRSASSAKP